ncbi:uncharacterized protein C8Q71DRAFT_764152 [Rhodofomes roseus]|uniref:Fungal-type protein kinase domain-containing protein n=1 Tax=Rhodofomes roseus TaxID=34475 RepID=A0ABQ8KCP1_9APHY|nr:uncharacterized protein C8Q71DRAFT_764152 [Rhodofomes roseus]KAH9835120.1 hypothetical protein C8Q71DRAFT_764152 [Rhodofomes roseus]
MKSSWRDPLKIPETEVYTLIGQLEGCPRGVARPLYGGDVCYYEVLQTWSKLTVASRRRQGSDAPVQGPAPCCSSEIRRAAMEVYRRAATAVRFHSIVEAHRYLCGHGILHQDINPSNMFLWSDEAALPPYTEDRPASGILASSDMAAVDDSLLAVSSVRRITPSNEGMADDKIPDKSKIETRQFTPRSVPEIDTLQFMALELLQAVHAGRDIPHTAAHDLESIAYVLGYTVLQHLVNTPGCHIALAEAFQEHFGYMTVKGIIYQHSGIRPLKWNYLQDCGSPAEAFIADHVSLAAISDLLDDLRLKVSKIHAAYEQRKLAETRGNMYNLQSTRQLSQDEFFDHAMLLELLGSTISYLEQHPEEIKYSAIHGSM